jgi:hypothetical protein
VARWRLTQATSFGALVAALPDDTRKTLADVYRVLSQGPLPGESVPQVEPLPGAPDTYTVPFAGAASWSTWSTSSAAPSSWSA